MKKHQSKQPAGQRTLKVGEEIRHILSETMQRGRFHDESLMDAHLITVTEVRVAPDLKNATAFVMPLGGRNVEPTIAALNHAAPYFQSQVAHAMRIKFTPHIRFEADTSFDEADKIERILTKIHEEDQASNA